MQRFRQRLSWTQQDQVATRTWESLEAEQATLLSEEHYRYDVRNRLVEATTQGPHLVTDPAPGSAFVARRSVSMRSTVMNRSTPSTRMVNATT